MECKRDRGRERWWEKIERGRGSERWWEKWGMEGEGREVKCQSEGEGDGERRWRERDRERATVLEERDGGREGESERGWERWWNKRAMKVEWEERRSVGERQRAMVREIWRKRRDRKKGEREREGKRKDRYLGSRDHITPALRQLQWLRVKFRVTYQLCLLLHAVYVGRYQGYIADLMTQK